MTLIDKRRRKGTAYITNIQISSLPYNPFKSTSFTPIPEKPESGLPKSATDKKLPRPKPLTKEHRKTYAQSYKPVPIYEISANAFHLNLKRKGNEFFSTSIYEVDRVLQERYDKEDPDTAKLIAEKLPAQYQSYTQAFSKTDSNVLPPHRHYDHKIILEAPLPDSYSPLYRQSTEELKVIKEYLIENLDKGFIESSQSPFASPVLFVKKADGGLRFCIDYRRLNTLTRKDAYPIPRIDELLARVFKARIFIKLDIRAAFNRIRMDPKSEEYTTFRTRYGVYKYKVLPFGLYNGPGTYQRYINDVLLDYLNDFCMAYLDDILIYSESAEEHKE
ncbi:hypothetical protein VTL71DRAFT_3646 [Oculimacula yallundae]|uniref:Reverse transcriptase domain-containing protein n=1 Tax=Oculimacula yallundae TaxID=86028 RepID=A0ABR4C3M1_9HELO